MIPEKFTKAYSKFLNTFKKDISRSFPNVNQIKRIWFIVVDSGLRATLYIRLQEFFQDVNFTIGARLVSRKNLVSHGIDIVPGASIGPGLILRHPSGIVIGHKVVIGSDATILQGVTLGQKDLSANEGESSYPVIADGVTIGAGAIVLGDVIIAKGASVGAGSVVLSNVKEGELVAGIPAKVIG